MSGAPYTAATLPNAKASVNRNNGSVPPPTASNHQLQKLCVISISFLNSNNGSASSITASITAAGFALSATSTQNNTEVFRQASIILTP